jgi:hypothetical protein
MLEQIDLFRDDEIAAIKKTLDGMRKKLFAEVCKATNSVERLEREHHILTSNVAHCALMLYEALTLPKDRRFSDGSLGMGEIADEPLGEPIDRIHNIG